MAVKPVLVAGLIALVACTPGAPPPETTSAVISTASVSRGDLGGQLNAVRATNGLPALRPSSKLAAAARAHANDMAARGFFSHTGSDKSTISQRVRRQGYSFCFVAENIAKGQPTPQITMASWQSSRGHRANNLSREATEYGEARAAGNIWVLVFGRPGC